MKSEESQESSRAVVAAIARLIKMPSVARGWWATLMLHCVTMRTLLHRCAQQVRSDSAHSDWSLGHASG